MRCALVVFVAFLSLNEFVFAADDVTPPVIVHEPVTAGTEGQRIIVEAVITDDAAVAEATLHYRKIGDLTYSTVPMALCAGCIDVYEAAIPASAVTSSGVEYYISATDGTNTATHPATNPSTSPHVIEVTKPNQPPWIWLIALALVVVVIATVSIMVRKKAKRVSEK